MSMATQSGGFVRTVGLEAKKPPILTAGPIAWMRDNLFSSIPNTLLTLLAAYALWVIVPPLIQFFIIDAVWTGKDRDACLESVVGRPVGACWASSRDPWPHRASS